MKILNKEGFTLVELIIVLAIMAILSAIALPSFQNYMAQRRLSGATRELYGNLSLARLKAVTMNQWIALNIDDGHRYTIFKDDNKDGIVDNGEAISTLDIHPTYRDVNFSTASGTVFTFYPNGTGATGTLNLTNPTGSKRITISSAGRIKIN
jgi:type II secretion system protein H